jgi:hypothetical protein
MSYNSFYLDWVFENVKKGSKILKIGSGNSSILLNKNGYVVYTIEESENCRYCHAPLINYKSGTKWYDRKLIKKFYTLTKILKILLQY